MICPGNERLWQKFSEVLGHPEWTEDPRYFTNRERVERRDEVNKMVSDVILEKSRKYWQKKLDKAGVPCSPLNTVPEVLELSQTRALNMFFKPYKDHSGLYHGLPISFDGKRAGNSSQAPKLGDN